MMAMMMENTVAIAGVGVVLVMLMLFFRWKWRALKISQSEPECVACAPMQVVHRLCPHHNVVQGFQVEEKDSLDEHLDVLTRKLAEKEGRLRLSKSKIRETQNEIDNLHAIDQTVRYKYREIMDSLKTDLTTNEKECKKLQEQIEWVSRRRAELKDEILKTCTHVFEKCMLHDPVTMMTLRYKYAEITDSLKTDLTTNEKECKMLQDQIEWVSRRWAKWKYEVRHGQRLYGEAAAELASNLAEMQRGRIDHHVFEKPYEPSTMSLRHRKEPQLPRSSPLGSIIIKSPPSSQPTSMYPAERDQSVP